MIAIRHTGIYVDDIDLMEDFYVYVFDMLPICSKEKDRGELFEELLDCDAEIMTSKLVTPYGKKNGQGDMLELVKVIKDINPTNYIGEHPIYLIGTAHIAFGVDDIQECLDRIICKNGIIRTKNTLMKNGNRCCFCTDPEGNWIELIQRRL